MSPQNEAIIMQITSFSLHAMRTSGRFIRPTPLRDKVGVKHGGHSHWTHLKQKSGIQNVNNQTHRIHHLRAELVGTSSIVVVSFTPPLRLTWLESFKGAASDRSPFSHSDPHPMLGSGSAKGPAPRAFVVPYGGRAGEAWARRRLSELSLRGKGDFHSWVSISPAMLMSSPSMALSVSMFPARPRAILRRSFSAARSGSSSDLNARKESQTYWCPKTYSGPSTSP